MDLELDISHLAIKCSNYAIHLILHSNVCKSVICVSRQEALLDTKLSMCVFS